MPFNRTVFWIRLNIVSDDFVLQFTDVSRAMMPDDENHQFFMTISLRVMFNYTLIVNTYRAHATGPFSVSAISDRPITFLPRWLWRRMNKIDEHFSNSLHPPLIKRMFDVATWSASVSVDNRCYCICFSFWATSNYLLISLEEGRNRPTYQFLQFMTLGRLVVFCCSNGKEENIQQP